MNPILETSIARWGYVAVGVGVFFEGETIVIVAGAMANRDLLWLPGVIIAAFAGSLLGDQLWFHLGHRFGPPFINRRPRWKRQADRAEALLARFGTPFVIGFRFLYGFRTITPVMLGVTGYNAVRYTIYNTIGAALWATAFSVAGYTVGASLVSLLGRAAHAEELVLAGIAVGALIWLLTRMVSAAARRRHAHEQRAPEGAPDGKTRPV